jgi:methylenetetrahydrofolate--tRNA-(uracil-5-)-methyltransferase
MESADINQIPGGKALVVDREKFAKYITEKLKHHPNIRFVCEEMTEIPTDRVVIVATGPLTSDPLAMSLAKLISEPFLHFYDAISPIVYAESIDWGKVFVADRYAEKKEPM